MYRTEVIAARDAKPGQEYFSCKKGDAPCYWWHRITDVKVTGETVTIHTVSFYTTKHPAEGITVRWWDNG